ncbi:MAG: hypothetical protein ACR2RV_00680 [Verrucomicrobiales bacterium]
MSKQQDTSICFPGEESWELWRQKSGIFELVETAEFEDGNLVRPFKSATHFAFPIVSAFAVPVWASSDDKAVVNGVVEMHLEGLGVKPGNPVGQLVDQRVALRKDGRSLVLATVLSEGYQLSLPKQSPEHFDVSARFLTLPSNHVTLWRELGRLVLAVTRDDSIVHFQALSAEQIDEEAVREIKCLMLQLATEGVVDEPAGLMLWVQGVEDPIVKLAEEELGMRVMRDLRPSPVLPEKGSKLLPTEVAIQRLSAERRRKIRNIALGLAAVWAAFIGYHFFSYFKAKKKANELARSMQVLRPRAEWIPEFKARYDQVKKAVEVEHFPVELFYLAAAKLPEKGVRFTDFSIEGDSIRIQGEAENSNAANKYGGVIFGADELGAYEWIWEKRPAYNTKRKDGTVEFAIFGKIEGSEQL